MLAALIILQAIVAEKPILDLQFDLGTVKRAKPDDIVVKGHRRNDRDAFSIPDLPAEPLLPRAEIGLAGKARIGVEAEQHNLPGAVSNRAMITIKTPF